MVLVHSFRYGFGADYSGTYQALFYDVKNGIPLPNLEYGYYLLTKFVASFTDDYVWELFAASVLTFVIVLLAIYRNSSVLTVSLSMIFLSAFYFDSTNTVRQEFAAAIFIYAVPYIKENKFWCGLNHVKQFYKPDGSIKNFGNVSWYTNLENSKRNERITTGKKYYGFEKMYPKYDNYDAINVDKVNDIPMDYFGVMGVPITFMDKYNPEQFEIIDGLNRYTILDIAQINNWAKANHIHLTEINGKSKYLRILIRRLKNDNEDISASN